MRVNPQVFTNILRVIVLGKGVSKTRKLFLNRQMEKVISIVSKTLPAKLKLQCAVSIIQMGIFKTVRRKARSRMVGGTRGSQIMLFTPRNDK